MSIEATLAVDAFGSDKARDLLLRWAKAVPDEVAMAALYREMTEIVRAELETIRVDHQ